MKFLNINYFNCKRFIKNRRKLAGFLVLVMLLSLSGCGKAEPQSYKNELSGLGAPGEGYTSSSSSDGDGSGTGSSGFDPDQQYAETENEEFEQFLMDEFIDAITSDSMTYNDYVMYADSYDIGDIEIPATLGDASMDEEAIAEAKAEDEEYYNRLIAFEDAELTEEERFTYECLKGEAELDMLWYDYIYFYEIFSPYGGLQSNIMTSFLEYRFDDASDVDDYIVMLGQLRDYFDKCIDFEYEKSEKGYFMCDKNVESVIDQCDDMLEKKDDHIMITYFDEKVDAMDGLTEEEKSDFKARNKEAVLTSYLPAFEDLKKAMQELKGTGKNDKGICFYDNGKEYYEKYVFPTNSGSSKTIEEEIDVMEKRMDSLFTEMMSLYYAYPEVYDEYFDKGDTLYDCYNDMEAADVVKLLMKDYMDDYPLDTEIPFEISYMSDTLATIRENTLAYYLMSPIDNPDNNIIRVNGHNTDDIFNTLAHEGCPGHMFQTWYFRNTNPNPGRALARNLGYMEGWAVYTAYNATLECDLEGEENGNILVQFDKINTDLGYLVEARCDIGINYEGWDIEDTKNFLNENGFNGDIAEDIYYELIGDPGYYFCYSVSCYEMEELRDKAEEELGSKFVLKDFHKAILDAGPCQFDMLAKKIDKYIYENK